MSPVEHIVVGVKPAEAQRRIDALEGWHHAVGEVLALTDFIGDEINWRRSARPKRGSEAEWAQARAKADQLAAGASRSFRGAGVLIEISPRGTHNRYPADPATSWVLLIGDDPPFRPDLLDTVTNQAIGFYRDAIADPQRHRAGVRVEGIAIRASLVAVLVGIASSVAGGAILYWLGWVG